MPPEDEVVFFTAVSMVLHTVPMRLQSVNSSLTFDTEGTLLSYRPTREAC